MFWHVRLIFTLYYIIFLWHEPWFLRSEHSFFALSSDFTEVINIFAYTSVIANEFMGPKLQFYGSNRVFGGYFRNPIKLDRT